MGAVAPKKKKVLMMMMMMMTGKQCEVPWPRFEQETNKAW